MLKLPHHKRYDFLPITKRKHYSWPGGKRLAFYVALNIEHFAFQCGYCTSGFVTGATVLMERLQREPVARKDLERTITEALDRHICRCTGYVRYFEAVREVVLATPGLVTS